MLESLGRTCLEWIWRLSLSLVVVFSFDSQILEVNAHLRFGRVALPHKALSHSQLILNQHTAILDVKAVSHDFLLVIRHIVIAVAVPVIVQVLAESHIDLGIISFNPNVWLILIAEVGLTDM